MSNIEPAKGKPNKQITALLTFLTLWLVTIILGSFFFYLEKTMENRYPFITTALGVATGIFLYETCAAFIKYVRSL